MPRAEFPYGHFVDSKCLRAGPRGFLRKWFFKGICFQARREKARVYCKRGGARGIRAFEQQSIKANREEKNAPCGIRTRTTGSEDRYSIQLS